MNKNFSLALAALALSIPLLLLQGCGNDSEESAPDSDSGQNITINGRTFSKTSFATVIPKDDSVTISSEKFPRTGNVFIWDRTVTLNSYEISKYEVTQELYELCNGKPSA